MEMLGEAVDLGELDRAVTVFIEDQVGARVLAHEPNGNHGVNATGYARNGDLFLGVAAVVVSNHGGRQLDAAPATIDVVSEIVEAIEGRAQVIVDGGVRRGADVVKAIALGASAVAIGRPIVWGLAVNGQKGVADVLELVRAEIKNTLVLCGCRSIKDVSRQILWKQQ